METWRLIPLQINNGFMNMSIDEAILNHVAKGESPNTIRFYRWKPSTVSIGFFQNVFEEVNLDLCEKLGVDVVRRITGGGAVYHDFKGEITYSVVYDENRASLPKEIRGSYAAICSGIILALRRMGLSPLFRGNKRGSCPDVVLEGKKISGNARTRRHAAILQHGTILLRVNPNVMFRVLRKPVPSVNDGEKAFKIACEKVKGINDVSSGKITIDEIYRSLIEGFQEALKVNLEVGELSSSETSEAELLCKRKYRNPEWLFNRHV